MTCAMTKRNPSLAIAASLIAAMGLAGQAPAQQAPYAAAPYLLVQTGQSFTRLQDALTAIGSGTGTIRIAPGTRKDCGVQIAGNVSFVAQIPGQTVFDGQLCEGKAALVLRGRSARVEGLVFANLRVDDGNGAGIRLESGNLAVSQSWFHDSEQGILANNDPTGTIAIDRSTFTHLGRCDRGLACAHSVYINHYNQVSVTRCRFELGDGGHYLKVRAANVSLLDNSFDDARGHNTNYMIDLPSGATGRIAGNWFVAGQNKENSTTFIAVAAEGRDNSSNGLTSEGNTARLVPGLERATAFVSDWSGDHLVIGSNQLAPGVYRFLRR